MKVEIEVCGVKCVAETDYSPGFTGDALEAAKLALFTRLSRDAKEVAMEYVKNMYNTEGKQNGKETTAR